MTLLCLRRSSLLLTLAMTLSNYSPIASAQEPKSPPADAAQDKTNDKPATEKATQVTDKDVDDKVPEKVVSEKDAIKQLVGDYRIVAGENSGKQILPDRLAGITVRITEQTITTYDGDRQEKFGAAYRLDTQKRPWRIMMTSIVKADAAQAKATRQPDTRRETSEGLLDIGESQVKLIYALPNGETPKSFKAGARQQLFVLEKLKATPQAQPAGAEGNSTTNPNP
jgi:uncharacterized protein (TIGR03067 family)